MDLLGRLKAKGQLTTWVNLTLFTIYPLRANVLFPVRVSAHYTSYINEHIQGKSHTQMHSAVGALTFTRVSLLSPSELCLNIPGYSSHDSIHNDTN